MNLKARGWQGYLEELGREVSNERFEREVKNFLEACFSRLEAYVHVRAKLQRAPYRSACLIDHSSMRR